MRASGNSDPQICVQNLLQTVRGEVPFARIKGLDGANIDAPSATAEAAIIADATWLINTYEPRVNANEVVVDALEAMQGDFQLSTTVSEADGTVEVDK